MGIRQVTVERKLEAILGASYHKLGDIIYSI